MRSAPFSELYCSSISSYSCSFISAYSLEEKYNSPTTYQVVEMHHSYPPTATRVVKSSNVFIPTADNHRRRAEIQSSVYAVLKNALINLLSPGTPVPSKSRKPSEILGWMKRSQGTARPKPSQVLGSIEATRKRRVLMPVEADQEPSGAVNHKIHPYPATSDEMALRPSCIAPAKKDASLRVTLLKHRALISEMESPSRPVAKPLTEEDEESDDEIEQMMNEFEGWNGCD